MLFSNSFYTNVVNDGLHEPYLPLTNSSFIFILSELHRGCLIWVKFVEILKRKFESQLSLTRSLFSDKACCFNQSERMLYGNFIIITIKRADGILPTIWSIVNSCLRVPTEGTVNRTIIWMYFLSQVLSSKMQTNKQFKVTCEVFCLWPYLQNRESTLYYFYHKANIWNFVICYAGKGFPLERLWTKNRALAINRNIVPTVQVAVQMCSGTLTTEQTFGIDQQEQQLAKKDIRKTAFKNYFPHFDVIFQAIANGNYAFFGDAISYYIQLTRHLPRQ